MPWRYSHWQFARALGDGWRRRSMQGVWDFHALPSEDISVASVPNPVTKGSFHSGYTSSPSRSLWKNVASNVTHFVAF